MKEILSLCYRGEMREKEAKNSDEKVKQRREDMLLRKS